MSRGRLALIVFLLLVVVGTATWMRQQVAETGGETGAVSPVGRPAPAFSLPDLDGFPRDLQEWNGRVRVINFWASWCRPCRREMPAFVRLQQAYGGRGVQFIGIAIDKRAAVQSFLQSLGVAVNYPILIGEDEAIAVAEAYGNAVGVLPYTVVVDRAGTIVHVKYGEISEAETESLIRARLGGQEGEG